MSVMSEIFSRMDFVIQANVHMARIYVRVPRVADSKFSTTLLYSKSRVAPLRPVSLPRLELCAALLLAQLLSKVQSVTLLQIESYYN